MAAAKSLSFNIDNEDNGTSTENFPSKDVAVPVQSTLNQITKSV